MTPFSLRQRRITDSIAILFSQSYLLARSRATNHSFAMVRLMAERDQAVLEAKLLQRELEVLRRNRESLPAHRRPPFAPADRLEILQLMRLRDWNIQKTADRFALHKNTVWQWLREFKGGKNIGLFFGTAPFNKLHEAAGWLVHEIRALCPQPEFGTRAIAMQIVQAGIKMSRSSVQRLLRQPKPQKPSTQKPENSRQKLEVKPFHLLRPQAPNRVWHLDLTTIRFLWQRFHIAALLDGYSRKLLVLKVYARQPTSAQMLYLVRTELVPIFKPRSAENKIEFLACWV
jgi:transposase